MNNTIKTLETPRIALRLAFGLVPLLAGLDKFTYLLTDWSQYVAPAVRPLLPIAPETFLYIAGIVEVLVGLAILTRWTELGSYVAAAWLGLIAVNLILAGYFDVAVRDLVMAVGAFTLGRLTAVHESAAVGAEVRHSAARRAEPATSGAIPV
jgi:uncharacterized membrane protein YphA (DoxX/SURF4 family)